MTTKKDYVNWKMLLTRICVLFTAIFTTALSSAATTLSTEAWFTSSYHPEEPYPEQSDPPDWVWYIVQHTPHS